MRRAKALPSPESAADRETGRAGELRRPPPPADGGCALCRRALPLTFHHLIPRRVHDRPWFRAQFGLDEMRRRGLWLCRDCHRHIHAHFDEATLGRRLNTAAALLAEPVIARHVEWAARQRVARA